MIDPGLDELIDIIKGQQFGNGQVDYKKHKGIVAQIGVSKANSHKIEGWKGLLTYIAEIGKWHQANATKGTRHKFTFTIDVNDKGEVERLTENEYTTKHFSVPI